MNKKTSDAQLKANVKHDKANFEYFTVKARKGKRIELKAHVESQSKPLNTWLLEAIEEKLQRDNETKKDCQE